MSAAQAEPAHVTATTFLTELFTGLEHGWVHLFAVDRTTGEKTTRWNHVTKLDELILSATPLLPTSCIWFGPATRRQQHGANRGTAAECEQITALWVDIDCAGPTHANPDLPPDRAAARQLLDDYPHPPTAIIDTGGGIQAWWLLQEPLDREQALTHLTRWGATWAKNAGQHDWHIDNVFDLARVMRLPATWNRKDGATPVTVTHWHPDRRYTIDELDQWLIDPPPAPPSQRHDVPYIGPERPGSAYNIATDPADILTAAGCIHDHDTRSSGERHYRAPHHATERGSTGLTVYPDGHTTIWSESFARDHGLQTRRPYDAFGLYTHLHHHGDWRAATQALADRGYGTGTVTILDETSTTPETIDATRQLAHIVDWATFWASTKTDEDWLAHPMIPRGRAIALYAPAKAGKSSVVLALVAALATGRPIFGQTPVDPQHVLYLDYEMTEADLMERLIELGYNATDDLSHLHYALLPSLPPLDTKEGATAVLTIAQQADAALVVVDTFGRAVQGDENEADTVRAFYRHTGLALKAAGRAVIRTDHAGKDLEKGQRGTSAKADDVDVVWQLRRTDTGIALKCTHSRLTWVPKEIVLDRREDDNSVIHWTLFSGGAYPEGTKEMWILLDQLGVPVQASARRAAEAIRGAGHKGTNAVIRAAQRARQNAEAGRTTVLDDPDETPGKARRNVSGAVPTDGAPTTDPAPTAQSTNSQVDDSARPTARHGAAPEPHFGATPPSIEGAPEGPTQLEGFRPW